MKTFFVFYRNKEYDVDGTCEIRAYTKDDALIRFTRKYGHWDVMQVFE